MLDENLMRAELSPAERAKATARRKAVYLKLHPETAHGSPGVSRQVGDTGPRSEAERFTTETAAASGRSERAVQRDNERGEKVTTAALDKVAGTPLDSGAHHHPLLAALLECGQRAPVEVEAAQKQPRTNTAVASMRCQQHRR